MWEGVHGMLEASHSNFKVCFQSHNSVILTVTLKPLYWSTMQVLKLLIVLLQLKCIPQGIPGDLYPHVHAILVFLLYIMIYTTCMNAAACFWDIFNASPCMLNEIPHQLCDVNSLVPRPRPAFRLCYRKRRVGLGTRLWCQSNFVILHVATQRNWVPIDYDDQVTSIP